MRTITQSGIVRAEQATAAASDATSDAAAMRHAREANDSTETAKLSALTERRAAKRNREAAIAHATAGDARKADEHTRLAAAHEALASLYDGTLTSDVQQGDLRASQELLEETIKASSRALRAEPPTRISASPMDPGSTGGFLSGV
ncbi:MAG TPA: hypothetical protein VKV04_20315 [Verrucomicrobiae bacterium]|nr:hypothetical protein [Verrucomicrobiae bacterium]